MNNDTDNTIDYKDYKKMNILYDTLENGEPINKKTFNLLSKSINNQISNTFDYKKYMKMKFLYNALNDGWLIKKIDPDQDNEYVLSKNIMGKEEIYLEKDYTRRFIVRNMLNDTNVVV